MPKTWQRCRRLIPSGWTSADGCPQVSRFPSESPLMHKFFQRCWIFVATIAVALALVIVRPDGQSCVRAAKRGAHNVQSQASIAHPDVPHRLASSEQLAVKTPQTSHAQVRVRTSSRPVFRLPGEFEKQGALLLSGEWLVDCMPDLFAEIVAAAHNRIQIVCMANDFSRVQSVEAELLRRRIPTEHVHFVELPHDTMWSRDYGPVLVKGMDGRVAATDAQYIVEGRERDDVVPANLAWSLNIPLIDVPLEMDGGNLLSNGEGLLLTTSAFIERNVAAGHDPESIPSILSRVYGCSQVVFLEALAGEPTAHVDMFATFTSPTTVVVGYYDPQVDPTNAAILDKNAARLGQVRTQSGPLKVIRIPMPANKDGVWRTYTNVVYANGTLLMPAYPSVDPAGGSAAATVFQRLLRKWTIMQIDAEDLAKLGGALHCVALNLTGTEHQTHFCKKGKHPCWSPFFDPELASTGHKVLSVTVGAGDGIGTDGWWTIETERAYLKVGLDPLLAGIAWDQRSSVNPNMPAPFFRGDDGLRIFLLGEENGFTGKNHHSQNAPWSLRGIDWPDGRLAVYPPVSIDEEK